MACYTSGNIVSLVLVKPFENDPLRYECRQDSVRYR
jgi:hypothetical protein